MVDFPFGFSWALVILLKFKFHLHGCIHFYDMSQLRYLSGTRLAVSVRGDEPYEELDILKDVEIIMLLHNLPFSEEKNSRVHSARR